MKKLIVMRHGAYSADSLTDYGQSQVRSTALQLKEILGDNSSDTLIVHSGVTRAIETADIVSDILEIPKEYHTEEMLLEYVSHEEYWELIHKLEKICYPRENMIVSAHQPNLKEFPMAVAHRFHMGFLRKSQPFSSGYAHAAYLDKQQPEYKVIQPRLEDLSE